MSDHKGKETDMLLHRRGFMKAFLSIPLVGLCKDLFKSEADPASSHTVSQTPLVDIGDSVKVVQKISTSKNEILEMLCPRCRNWEKRQVRFGTSLLNKRGVVHDWYCHDCAYIWHIYYIKGEPVVIGDGIPGSTAVIVEGSLDPLESGQAVLFLRSEAWGEHYDTFIERWKIVKPSWKSTRSAKGVLQVFLDRLVFAQELLANGEIRQGMSQIQMASSDLARKLGLKKKSVDKLRELANLAETRREEAKEKE